MSDLFYEEDLASHRALVKAHEQPVSFDRVKPIGGGFTLTTFSFSEWAAAVQDCPEGGICGWCGAPNFWCDDCGFFYITPEGNDTRPTCEACYRGPKGEAHVKRYGVGDR